MLREWLQQLQNATVSDLIETLDIWIKEGYVKTDIWRRLQKLVAEDALPSFHTRRERRQPSLPSELLSPARDSGEVKSCSGQPSSEDSLAQAAAALTSSPTTTTGKQLLQIVNIIYVYCHNINIFKQYFHLNIVFFVPLYGFCYQNYWL